MRFLVIGLGSMGKRRIRCLNSLGYNDVSGFDIRQDRLAEAQKQYGIKPVQNIDELDLENQIDAIIVATPPDRHTPYIKIAIDNKKPAFVEASVLLDHVVEILNYNKNNCFVAPSCTLRFHPIIREIKSIVQSGKYGKVTNFSYHSGQYLPDWHPWENVNEFYVSNRDTGGGREIVPFELTWIVDTIGWPARVKGVFGKTLDVGADVDDTYAFLLDYKTFFGSVIVDVASRYATRNLILNMESAQLLWNWDDGAMKVYEADSKQWLTFQQPHNESAAGYNKNIIEQMYIEEVESFVKGIKDPARYPNNLKDDLKILKILKSIEKSYGGFQNGL
jgi:predicted dehydrogenase